MQQYEARATHAGKENGADGLQPVQKRGYFRIHKQSIIKTAGQNLAVFFFCAPALAALLFDLVFGVSPRGCRPCRLSFRRLLLHYVRGQLHSGY